MIIRPQSEDYSHYYNKGNDCDCCKNQYLYGKDGDMLGCHCRDNNTDCHYIRFKTASLT